MGTTSLQRRHFSILFISLAFISFAAVAHAQSALDGFDPNANDTVRVVVVQPDGKILIGGDFTSLAPNGGVSVTRNRIARLNPDGTLDAAFNPNSSGSVRSIAVQSDGSVLAGGSFTSIGGQLRNRIARLDASTGLADSFNPNASSTVFQLIVQPDGMILAGGQFTSIGGQTRNRIARLDPTTGLADSFDPNASSVVLSLALQPDGKILAGGLFSLMGGQTRNRIARLNADGTLDSGFNPNSNGDINSIAIQADGKIVVGGIFGGVNSIGGQTRNGIARLNSSNGLADSFNPNPNAVVYSVVVQPDGKILTCGEFSSIGGQSRNLIARLDPGTGLADLFNPNANGFVRAMTLQQDAKVLVGGDFNGVSSIGGATRNFIARLETDGRADRTLDLGSAGGSAGAIAVQLDGKILIGGSFTTVLGVPRNNIARLNTDGTLDTTFDPDANGSVSSIAVQADGKIVAGGNFTSIGGQPRNRIARLSATTGSADSFNPNANAAVSEIALQTDGRILVCGNFTTIGGQTRNSIARLDAVTGLADAFNPNPISGVVTIAVQLDGKILVGGAFTNIGGQARNRIARLNAATGSADSFNPNADDFVGTIAVQTDGNILASGTFSNIGGQPRNHIARLDATTGLADSFNPNLGGSGEVYSFAVQADGHVLAGGFFGTIGGQPRNGMARLDAVTGAADSFNPGGGFVGSIALQTDGKILAGGSFANIGGQPRDILARLTNDTPAQQNLSATQTAVTWTRGGSSPQVTRVTFEDSTDGVNYNFLGHGTRSGSDWTLTGLNLSVQQNIFIRARGYFNGSERILESVRNAFISPSFTIGGTVTYGNAIGSPAPPRFVKNVSVASTVGSPSVGPVITGTPGTYALTGFGAGSYTIKPTKPGGATTAITSNDAARVAQGVTGSLPFVSQNQRFAADVTGNGNISSQDAAKIAQFVAGLPFSPPNNTGQWKFFATGAPSPLPTPPQVYDDSRSYASVTSSLTGEDYVGILVGEASGNWNPATHPRPVGSRPLAEDSGQLAVAVAVGSQTTTEKEIVVPINVHGVANKGIISYEFDLRYDPAVIQPLAESVDVAGTVSRGLSVVVNPYEPGLLRVVVYGPMPITDDGVLLNLRFVRVGASGSVSSLVWERFMFNEGEAVVSLVDGQVVLFDPTTGH